MSLDAISSIDNANDPKSRAAQIAKLQAYAARTPLVSKKQEDSQAHEKVAKLLVSQPAETASFEGLFSYSPALIPQDKTQAPANYSAVERNISDLILDMLPIIKAMTNAMNLIGKNQEAVQGAIGNLWAVHAQISKIYTAAIEAAQKEQDAAKEKAIHKIGLFGFIAGIFEAVTAIFTDPCMFFDGLTKAAFSLALLIDPSEYDNEKFMSFQKNGLMGIFGKDGEKAQYIFQALLVVASLGSSFASLGLGKVAAGVAEKEILGVSLKSAGKQIGKWMDAASAQMSKAGEIIANNFIFKAIIWPFVQFGKLLSAMGEFLCTGAKWAAEKAMKLCLALARVISKIPGLGTIKDGIVAFFRACAKELSAAGTKIGNSVAVKKFIELLTKAYHSVMGKILGMINDLISLSGLMIALFKKEGSGSDAENSMLQSFLNSLQNGFVGLAATAPFAIQEANGHKPNEILQNILSVGVPLVLNQGLMANSVGKNLAQADQYNATIAKWMTKFQSFVGNLGAAGSATSTGNVAFQAVHSKALADIKAESDFQQSLYTTQSMLLDSRIDALQNSSGDIQKIIESLAQGVLNFISAISQDLAISNRAVA